MCRFGEYILFIDPVCRPVENSPLFTTLLRIWMDGSLIYLIHIVPFVILLAVGVGRRALHEFGTVLGTRTETACQRQFVLFLMVCGGGGGDSHGK